MPSVHVIRLRDPWERTVEQERPVWRRAFHAPSGLTATTRVILVLADLASAAAVSLNGATLSPLAAESADVAFDITPLLGQHNRLVISLPPSNALPFTAARLEIREPT